MKNQDYESRHFEAELDAKSYLFIALWLCSMLVIALNIYKIEHKKTEAPTSVSHNINP